MKKLDRNEETYNGFRIIPVLVFKEHKNEISGHSWMECIGTTKQSCTIQKIGDAKLIYTREHTSIKKAKAEIDFAIKFPFKAC